MSKVAERAFDLLEMIVGADRPMGMMELAETAGLDKSTASRMLAFFVRKGLAARDPETQKYRAGPRFMLLAASAIERFDIRIAASGELMALRTETGETTALHLRIGLQRVCVYGIESPNDVRTAITSAEARPLHSGASGLVMLAQLPPAEQDAALAGADLDEGQLPALRETLAGIRSAGCHCLLSDRIPGLAAASAAIFGPGGVVAAITVTGPANRWDMEKMTAFLPRIRMAAQRISASLGATR